MHRPLDGLRRPLGALRRSRPARTVALVALVAAPALLLRLWALGGLGLNSDEAVYAGQAASVIGAPDFVPYFPVFRAHPLLFQSLLSVEFRVTGVVPLAGRLTAVAFGLATIGMTYAIGARLYGRRAGVLAALLIGVMPYAIVVDRQILLDGPMAFFAALTLYLLVRFVQTGRASWLYAAAGALGLATLTKETAAILASGAIGFFALTVKRRVGLRQVAVAGAVFVLTVLPYPVTLALSGRTSTGGAFLTWQLLRRSNHPWWFYLTAVPPALGIGLVLVVGVGLVLLRRSLGWPELLLVCWIAGPCLVFEVWSVKGFQYLLPTAVPMAVLAASVLVAAPLPWRNGSGATARGTRMALAAALVLSLALTSWFRIQPASAGPGFLAGTGGVPGGREAGRWIGTNLPEGTELLALGPSMANILEFYGRRQVYGLSVSSNPLHRNPVYEPVRNPDAQIRHGTIQYLVWDSFSASRSPFYADRLLQLVERHHGRIVHRQYLAAGPDDDGSRQPVITIYEVTP